MFRKLCTLVSGIKLFFLKLSCINKATTGNFTTMTKVLLIASTNPYIVLHLCQVSLTESYKIGTIISPFYRLGSRLLQYCLPHNSHVKYQCVADVMFKPLYNYSEV